MLAKNLADYLHTYTYVLKDDILPKISFEGKSTPILDKISLGWRILVTPEDDDDDCLLLLSVCWDTDAESLLEEL